MLQFVKEPLIIEWNSYLRKGAITMKVLKRIRWTYLLLSIFLIAIGVCLFMWPEVSMDMVCMIAGGGAVFYGLTKIVIYFVRQINAMVEQYDFSVGVLSIMGGAVLLIQPAELLNLLPQVLAVAMLVDCIFKMQVVLDAKRLDNSAWFLQFFVLLVCAAWGVCLIVQPFGLDAYMSQMFAGGLIADGVLNFLTVIFIAVTVKKLPEQLPAPAIPDPIQKQERITASSAAPQPEEDVLDVEESGLQVRDLIEESREQTNQPEGKGGIFGFFKK